MFEKDIISEAVVVNGVSISLAATERHVTL